jgi:hypothetical protein
MMRTDCGMLAWPAVVLVLCVTLRDGFAADRAGKRMVPFRGLRLGADDGLGRRSVVCSGVVSSLPSVCPFGTLRASSYGHTTNGFSPHVRLFVPGTFNSSLSGFHRLKPRIIRIRTPGVNSRLAPGPKVFPAPISSLGPRHPSLGRT